MNLKWLDKPADYVTFGVPHKKGEVMPKDTFVLEADGEQIPTDTSCTAYWGDGSVKWSLHSAVFDKEYTSFELKKGYKNAESSICAEEINGRICIDTGKIKVEINKSGEFIIDKITANNTVRAEKLRLVVLNENRFETAGCESTVTEKFYSSITECMIENAGVNRAVVRVRGTHMCKNKRSRNGGARCYLPFDVRMYFYRNSDEIKIVHTFIFDGEQNTDFIKGIGIECGVNLTGALYNRYVRFGGERGLYVDSPKGLLTWRTTGKYHDMYKRQNNCEYLEFDEKEDERFLGLLDESAVWNDFKITQLSSEEYNIQKRTGEGCVYIKGHMGRRALGIGYLGDTYGGVAVHMDKFWQKYPSTIECRDTTKETGKIIAWLWSPESAPMDLRHYDTRTHVYSGYEGFEEMRATPYGIANTNEVSFKIYAENPTNTEVLEWCRLKNSNILLIAEPQYYCDAGVLGEWSVDDRSTDAKRALEEQNDRLLEFYKRESETRRWYGFWDFGDFMHTYDDVHNCWKYDMGGQAWQNTELVPNLWLWYGFLRSGRNDFFEMAKNMTRHTSEVDVYHIGEYARLGSRHNVVHWGCGCKESRISMAHLHKIFYYLTGDARTGDILDEVVDVDFAVGELDPMRAYHSPSTQFKTHVRFGPDVMSFCSNWFTYWERHQSEKYYNKLMKTLEFFKKGHRFVVSGVYGYDPDTTTYYDFMVEGGSHFMHCFGNLYVWLEIADCLEDNEIKERLMDLGQFYGTSEADQAFKMAKYAEWGLDEVPGDGRLKHASYNVGISAMAAKYRNDRQLADEIWHMIHNDPWLSMPLNDKVIDKDNCHKVLTESYNISTNAVGQWGTNVYVALKFIGDLY